MKVLGFRILLAIAFAFLFTSTSPAQQYVYSVGTPSFTTAEPVELGFINLANGNLHLEIPISSSPQRGNTAFSASLVYDSRIWNPSFGWHPTNVRDASGGNSLGGWRLISTGDRGQVEFSQNEELCAPMPGVPDGIRTTYGPFWWTDPSGTRHIFDIFTIESNGSCGPGGPLTGTAMADDASGLRMDVTSGIAATVTAKDGTKVYLPGGTQARKDPNGNYFTTSAPGVIDTLGRRPVTKTVASGSTTFYDILDSKGGTFRVTVSTPTISVTTSFGQAGVAEYSGGVTVISDISLPNGTSYHFNYDSFGVVSSVTLPTGGIVNFGHSIFSDAYGNKNRWATSRTVNGAQWTYTPQVITSCGGGQNCVQTVTVTRPSGDQSVYTFTLNNGAWNSQLDVYNGAVLPLNLLQSTTSSYDFSQPCSGTCTGAQNIRKLSNTTTVPIPGGISLKNQVQYSYDSPENGNITFIKEWNFINAAGSFAGTPDRQTHIVYENNTNLVARNIIDRPKIITLETGAGTALTKTEYVYDTGGIVGPAGVIGHDGTGYGTGFNFRGNPTVIKRFPDAQSASGSLDTTLAYDATGQVVQVTDPNSKITTFSYADRFFVDATTPSNPPSTYSPAQTNAYLTQVTLPAALPAAPQMTSLLGYYFHTGKPAFTQDSNGANSYTHYGADILDRLKHTYGPLLNGNRPWSLIDYAGPTQVDTYGTLNEASPATTCSSCRHDRAVTDAWGRVTQTSLVNDPQGEVKVTTNYDSSGRVSQVSNPFRSPSDTTYGLETPAYDGLNRVSQVTHHDSQVARTFYGRAVEGNGGQNAPLCSGVTAYPTLLVDEAGKKRQMWSDGFGRLLEVDEPDSAGALSLKTCYTYNPQGDLTQVQQVGPTVTQTRSYQHDSLHRLTQSTTPESGTENLLYLISGAKCSGDPSAICRRTDARGISATYTYDALNRVTLIDYSDTTPDVSYFYDQTTFNGLNITNGKGRRTGMSDGSGQTAWSYDAAGNPLAVRKTINGSPNQTNTVSYTYNLNGSVASLTYPSGRVVNYTYNNAFQPTSAKDPARTSFYASGAVYAPHGALAGMVNGNVPGGQAGVTTSNNYNNRLLPTLVSAASSMSVLSLNYSYFSNGLVQQVTNNRVTDHSRDLAYTYDELNRIKTAASGTLWCNTFNYDRFGNLLEKDLTCGTGEELPIPADPATNRVVGYSYDAAGNQLTDGLGHTFTYDAQNKMASVSPSGVTFTYDGDGVRVKKSGWRMYWTGMGTEVLAESDLSGVMQKEYIYFAGRRVGFRSVPTDTPFYYFNDHLGSANVITNGSGSSIQAESDFYPFGGERVITNLINNRYEFTGKEQDNASEGGLTHFVAREYTTNLGRFMSPDLLAGNIGNPQSLNRYAYVLNSPLNAVDPLGLEGHSLNCMSDENGNCIWQGGGGGTCFMDGGMVPCGIVEATLRAGAGVLCPDGICNGTNRQGRRVQYHAFANGAGYYALSGPGALYFSADAAGRAASLYYESATGKACDPNGNRCERSGNVYVDPTGEIFSFTEALIGPPCAPTETCLSGGMYGPIPAGMQLVGQYHTHPYDRSVVQFGGDIPGSVSNPNLVPEYVGTPPGRVFKIEPVKAVLFIGGVAGAAFPVCRLQGPTLLGVSSCR